MATTALLVRPEYRQYTTYDRLLFFVHADYVIGKLRDAGYTNVTEQEFTVSTHCPWTADGWSQVVYYPWWS